MTMDSLVARAAKIDVTGGVPLEEAQELAASIAAEMDDDEAFHSWWRNQVERVYKNYRVQKSSEAHRIQGIPSGPCPPRCVRDMLAKAQELGLSPSEPVPQTVVAPVAEASGAEAELPMSSSGDAPTEG